MPTQIRSSFRASRRCPGLGFGRAQGEGIPKLKANCWEPSPYCNVSVMKTRSGGSDALSLCITCWNPRTGGRDDLSRARFAPPPPGTALTQGVIADILKASSSYRGPSKASHGPAKDSTPSVTGFRAEVPGLVPVQVSLPHPESGWSWWGWIGMSPHHWMLHNDISQHVLLWCWLILVPFWIPALQGHLGIKQRWCCWLRKLKLWGVLSSIWF